MIVATTAAALDQALAPTRASGKSLGFVPTMGALHRGHASLLRESARENELTVLSIYVNPTQFGKNEDFGKYPRAFEPDSKIARESGVDVIFHPANETIYPAGFSTFIEVEGVSAPLCGRYRPGHFRGVATVVNRLFQLVRPTRAYFGMKDIQQCLVLKRMVEDLAIPVELKLQPTIREADGLALSSRNVFLSLKDRESAPRIYKALAAVQAAFAMGERNTAKLESVGKAELASDSALRLQYLEVLEYPGLGSREILPGDAVCAVAAFLGETRLIDNVVLTAANR